jgi:RNA polymerase sigma-54 factor
MLRQIQRQAHRPLISAHLAQAMTLLHLSADELRETVERELSQNPALELAAAPTCPACGRRLARPGACPLCAGSPSGEPIVFTSPAAEFREYSGRRQSEEGAEALEPVETLSLAAHLLRQIAPELAVEDRPIAAHLLTGLDEDGLLATDPAEVAAYFHLPGERVEAVRRLIQRSDPLGCASRSPREALSSQLENLSETQPIPTGVAACLEAFDLLAHQKFAEIGQKLGLDKKAVEEAARFIGANLNPYPARAFWGTNAAPLPVYRRPEVVIRLSGDQPEAALIVEIAQPFGGMLRLNPLFKAALRAAEGEKLEDWKSDLERAGQLVKSVGLRARALELLMSRLASLQREFILHGEAHLAPLTRASLAKELEVHESTISRAVAGKSVQLPNGKIIPLAIFFEQHLPVRAALRELVAAETRPLSDDELATRLKAQGFPVARRTVTKYRAIEGILPATLRQSQKNRPKRCRPNR